jgi:LysR family transcriptional regulator, regulator for metE and metH
VIVKTAQRVPDPFTRYSGLELRHLRLVWTVAEERNLTRASERLRLTPSAISHQLRALEEVVSGPIFHRDGKRFRLTPAGDVLLDAATRVLGIIVDAEDRLIKSQQGRAGTVRLCTHCYTGYHWLPAVIRAFRSEHPEADVRVAGDATHRALEALYNREIDLAITPQGTDRAGMLVRPVLRDEVRLILPANHPLAKKAWLEPAEIAREHLFLYAGGPEESSLCVDILRPAGVWPRRHTNIQLTEAILELVKAGMGVAALAEWAVQPYLADGSVVAKRITRKGWRRTWNAITWSKAEAGPLVTSFVDRLAQEFGARSKTEKIFT